MLHTRDDTGLTKAIERYEPKAFGWKGTARGQLGGLLEMPLAF